jgi:ABC-2 type transport system ATP-binding protein
MAAHWQDWRCGQQDAVTEICEQIPVTRCASPVTNNIKMNDTPDAPAVEIEHLTKVFRVPSLRKQTVLAVSDLSLTVGRGEVYGLIGPNGSGKSTTMKVLLGLLHATSGKCSIFGRDSSQVDSRKDVGFLPENPYFYKHLTATETLEFYGRVCGLTKAERRDQIARLLKLVDLEHAKDRRLAGYSKGMLQRIGLAQALVQNPRLIVLDEPTAGVDPSGSRQIRDLILELKEQGISIILSSHLLEQVQEVCDRVGIIYKGDLVREGKLADLISIEDQTEIILKNASPALLEKVRALASEESTEVISIGRPRTTLERLFLEETQ